MLFVELDGLLFVELDGLLFIELDGLLFVELDGLLFVELDGLFVELDDLLKFIHQRQNMKCEEFNCKNHLSYTYTNCCWQKFKEKIGKSNNIDDSQDSGQRYHWFVIGQKVGCF